MSFYWRGLDSRWQLEVRGAAAGQLDWDNETHLQTPVTGSPAGPHTLVLEFRLDETGATSYTRAWIDDVYMGEVLHANTTHDTGDATYAPGMFMKMGLYTSGVGTRAGQALRILRHVAYNL